MVVLAVLPVRAERLDAHAVLGSQALVAALGVREISAMAVAPVMAALVDRAEPAELVAIQVQVQQRQPRAVTVVPEVLVSQELSRVEPAALAVPVARAGLSVARVTAAPVASAGHQQPPVRMAVPAALVALGVIQRTVFPVMAVLVVRAARVTAVLRACRF